MERRVRNGEIGGKESSQRKREGEGKNWKEGMSEGKRQGGRERWRVVATNAINVVCLQVCLNECVVHTGMKTWDKCTV